MERLEQIKICKNGIIKFQKDGELQPILPDNVILTLQERNFSLESGFKLIDYFKLFENYPLLVSITEQYFIRDFIEEYRDNIKNIILRKDEDYIFIKKTIEENILNKNECFLNVDVALYEKSSNEYYAIELSPIKEILGYNIKIISDIEDKKNTISKNKSIDASWTIYEFISEIISELSFCGPPQKRNEFSDSLRQMVKDIEEGKVELKPFNLEEIINDETDDDKDS